MKEYTVRNKTASAVSSDHAGDSAQAPAEAILRSYEKRMLQRRQADDDELLQGKFGHEPSASVESGAAVANTGLPNGLKRGVENLSGYSMDDVHVHYGSSEPARINALAYTKGTHIHVAPGQQRHLPHEAWHVVQQKQGRVRPTVQLQGVNINNDDKLEREADIMGARALGSLTMDRTLISSVASGRDSTSQLMGGDITNTKVLPRFGGVQSNAQGRLTHMSVRDMLAQKDRPGGRQGQSQQVVRDANHNNLQKVGFENRLALMILHCPDGLISGPIIYLTGRINEYINTKVTKGITQRQTELDKFLSPDMKAKYDTFFGRITRAKEDFVRGVEMIFNEGGDLYSQIQMQATFISEIYGKDFEAPNIKGILALTVPPNSFKDGTAFIGTSARTAIPYDQTHGDSRLKPIDKDSAYGRDDRDTDVPLSGAYYGISAREMRPASDAKKKKFAEPEKLEESPAPFQRGTDYWTANEESAFIQDARLNLDMPVTGTGASGTTAELLTCAKVFGLTGKGLDTYVIALLGYFIISGAHSFHEVMSIAGGAGIPYFPGDYFRTLDRLFAETGFIGPYQELKGEFKALDRPGPATMAPEPLRAAIFDGESSEDWTAPIAQAIAMGYGKTVGDLKELGGGRSAAPVYKVTVDGKSCVFKVFPDIREAETEIRMLVLLKGKGIPSVLPIIGPGGMSVCPVGGPISQKAGMLMEMAEGKSVDQMVGEHTPAADPRPLQAAVEATAALLWQLHNPVEKTMLMAPDRKRFDVEFVLKKLEAMDPSKKDAINAVPSQPGPTNMEKLQGYIKELGKAYLEARLRASVTHSDANAGNFIFRPEDAVDAAPMLLSVIDVATMEQSIDRNKQGMKTGAADVGRFLQSLLTGNPGKIEPALFAELQESFWRGYRPDPAVAAPPVVPADFAMSVLFHRFFLEIVVLSLAKPDAVALPVARIEDIMREFHQIKGLQDAEKARAEAAKREIAVRKRAEAEARAKAQTPSDN